MKNFDDFMKVMDSKDLSLLVDKVAKEIEGKPIEQATIISSLHIMASVLKEYHEWLNE